MVSLTIISETNKCLFASPAKRQRFASIVVTICFREICLIQIYFKTYLTFLYTLPYVVATQHLTIIQCIVIYSFEWNIWYFRLYRLLKHGPIHLCNQALNHTSSLRLISDWFTLSKWEIYTCVLRRCSITSERLNNLRLKVVSGWLHFPMIGFPNIWYR